MRRLQNVKQGVNDALENERKPIEEKSQIAGQPVNGLLGISADGQAVFRSAEPFHGKTRPFVNQSNSSKNA
jgi:hypothetical protein